MVERLGKNADEVVEVVDPTRDTKDVKVAVEAAWRWLGTEQR